MGDSPKSVIEVAKKTICPKKPFPFGRKHDSYSTECIIDVKTCKDICGRKCGDLCKEQHVACNRGHLSSSFLFCQFSSDEIASTHSLS